VSDRIVTVAKFLQPMEAHLFRSRLEADGIDAFVADENMANIQLYLSPVLGGLRVQVHESDAETAREILRDLERAESEEERTATEDTPICPACQSSNLTRRPKYWPFMAFAVLFCGIGGPLARGTWTCQDCGEKWTR
jgi:hypothetical protein